MGGCPLGAVHSAEQERGNVVYVERQTYLNVSFNHFAGNTSRHRINGQQGRPSQQ